MTSAKSPTWSQPLAVIEGPLEPLRADERVAQVAGEEHGEDDADGVLDVHGLAHSRSHPRTYAMLTAKKARVATTNRKSMGHLRRALCTAGASTSSQAVSQGGDLSSCIPQIPRGALLAGCEREPGFRRALPEGADEADCTTSAAMLV